MSTMANTTMVIRHPKDAFRFPARDQSVNGALDLQAWANFFEACAGGNAPGAKGETRISIFRGSTNAAPAFSQGKLTLASCLAQTVIEINGVPFTAISGTQVNDTEFDISGADTVDATKLAQAINACSAAGILGVLQASNRTCTIQLISVLAGDYVTIGGRRFTATAYPTARVGEFSIAGTNTQDATALAAAINADPYLSRLVFAESTTDTVTVRERLRSTSIGVTASSATFTLGGLTSGVLSASAVVFISTVKPGIDGNAITLKTLGVVASGTVTYSGSSGAQTVLINGVTVYNATGASDAANATAAAAAINASVDPLVQPFVRALARAGVCWVFAKQTALAGNAITLSATGTGATASGARLSGATIASQEGAQATGTCTITGGAGAEAAVINGVSISVTWATSDANTAGLLRDAINQSTNPLVRGFVYADAASNVVTITAIDGGVEGNAITLSATGTGNVASGARLTGGAAATTAVPSVDRLSGGVGGDSASPNVFQF